MSKTTLEKDLSMGDAIMGLVVVCIFIGILTYRPDSLYPKDRRSIVERVALVMTWNQ
jgi:hypothetical protein